MKTVRFLSAFLVAGLACAAVGEAAPISIAALGPNLQTVARGIGGGTDSATIPLSSTIPLDITLDTARDGTTAISHHVWSGAANTATLGMTMDYGLTAVSTSLGATTLNTVDFTAGVDAAYAFSGLYTQIGNSAISLGISFRDLTTNTSLFIHNQNFSDATNQVIEVGVTSGGDITNVLFGSATGALIAGHTYELGIQINLGNLLETHANASAGGFIDLVVTADTPALPAPGGALMLGFGLAAMVRRCR
jgi:hypothetical protein